MMFCLITRPEIWCQVIMDSTSEIVSQNNTFLHLNFLSGNLSWQGQKLTNTPLSPQGFFFFFLPNAATQVGNQMNDFVKQFKSQLLGCSV